MSKESFTDCQWSKQDEIALQATDSGEEVLWRRASEVFERAPGELLPVNINVETSDNKMFSTSSGIQFQSTNWAYSFCTSFVTVLLCPIFRGRQQYLRDVLRLARSYRLGTAKKSLINPVFANDGLEFPAHTEFLGYLEDAVFTGNKPTQKLGLVNKDLLAIIQAWDDYARVYGLKSMGVYKKQYTASLGRPGHSNILPRGQILEMKKQWIIRSRRYAFTDTESNFDTDEGCHARDVETGTLEDLHSPSSVLSLPTSSATLCPDAPPAISSPAAPSSQTLDHLPED